MERGWIARVSLAVGLAAALAWGLVFVMLVQFHHQPAEHVHWDRVAIGAAVAFVAGWGLVRIAARTPPEPKKENDEEY